jgi:mono/diheme cytochrome c family protein
LTVAPCLVLTLALAGCGDAFNAGPMRYVESEKLSDLKDKPELKKAVRRELTRLFGDDPQHIRVPAGAGLPNGGIHLANYRAEGESGVKRILLRPTSGGPPEPQEGGYALYRKHCLHCHGVTGAGDGPTAPFLYPRPRDYRKGMFKFTSTPNGAKPTREDLRKTIRQGLHGTSMPAFEPLMSRPEIEQVLDYLIFLSYRGETELSLIDEALSTGELTSEVATDVARSVFNKWHQAESQVVNPPVPKPPMTRESILRGRELFLGVGSGLNKDGSKKVDCTSCHGTRAVGDGPSVVSQDVFNDVIFGGDPSTIPERLAKLDPKTRELWKNSLDEWGNPVRPANLNRGVYKGGRRPIDLYWRIAKGINGAKMMAHVPAIGPEQVWDLVNFVLALPYEPALLEDVAPPAAAPPARAVARR